jgi:hypothetical protein
LVRSWWGSHFSRLTSIVDTTYIDVYKNLDHRFAGLFNPPKKRRCVPFVHLVDDRHELMHFGGHKILFYLINLVTTSSQFLLAYSGLFPRFFLSPLTIYSYNPGDLSFANCLQVLRWGCLSACRHALEQYLANLQTPQRSAAFCSPQS